MKIYLPAAATGDDPNEYLGVIVYGAARLPHKGVAGWMFHRKVPGLREGETAWAPRWHAVQFRRVMMLRKKMCWIGLHDKMDYVALDGSVSAASCITCQRDGLPPRHRQKANQAQMAQWREYNQHSHQMHSKVEAMQTGGECVECGLYNFEHAPDCSWGAEDDESEDN